MRKKQRSRADRPPQAPTRPEAHIRRAPHRIRQGHISGTQRARPHFSSLHRTGSGMPAPQPPPSHPWSLPRAQGAATNPPPIPPPRPGPGGHGACARDGRPPEVQEEGNGAAAAEPASPGGRRQRRRWRKGPWPARKEGRGAADCLGGLLQRQRVACGEGQTIVVQGGDLVPARRAGVSRFTATPSRPRRLPPPVAGGGEQAGKGVRRRPHRPWHRRQLPRHTLPNAPPDRTHR